MKDKLEKQKSVLDEIVEKILEERFFSLNLNAEFSKFKKSQNIWVLGAGKASLEMARQAELYFEDSIKDGIIIAPEKSKKLSRIQAFEGAHPYPDDNSVSSSYELWQLAKRIPQKDTVLFLLSGGASSLFCIPAKGIDLTEYKKAFELLLNSGADIKEINIVRKHLSETAGGWLGDLLSHNRLYSIILSDVPGDDAESIGSGPTVPDSSTFKHAFQILKQHKLWDRMPHSIRIHISKGMHGDSSETPKPKEAKWANHSVEVISGAKTLASNIGSYLDKKGYNVRVQEQAYDDDVKIISKKICSDAISILSKKFTIEEPAALIYFGESTVNVNGNGKGGRNQELALNAAISMEGQNPISLLSFATDGIDGPTDAAGAIINSQTTLSARKQKLEPEEFLQNNNSYHFHEEMETMLKTGPTGNNLMDLQVVLVGSLKS
jgi:hydroxypyruvate reductase/glycerate 2-kinase